MKTFIIEEEVNPIINDLETLKAKADKALYQLREMKDIPCSTIDEITPEAVKAFCKMKISEVNRASFLPERDREDLINKWNARKDTALSFLRVISAFMVECKECTFSVAENGIIPSKSLRAIAEELCTRVVPEQAEEHFKLIEEARKAIINLRTFEKKNNASSVSMGQVMSLRAEDVERLWVCGSVERKDYRYHSTPELRRIHLAIGRQ